MTISFYNPTAAVRRLMDLHGQHSYVMRSVDGGFKSYALDAAVNDSLAVISDSQFDFGVLIREFVLVCSGARKLCREAAAIVHPEETLASELTQDDLSLVRTLKGARDTFTSFIDNRPRCVSNKSAIIALLDATNGVALEIRTIGKLVETDEGIALIGIDLERLSANAIQLHSRVIDFATCVNNEISIHIRLFTALMYEQTKELPLDGESNSNVLAVSRFVKRECSKLEEDFVSLMFDTNNELQWTMAF